MKQISVMIKPASSLCNLRCKYCFYADVVNSREVRSFGKMKPEVMKIMLDQIFIDLDKNDHLCIVFQGGEPTLAGLDYFERFVAYAAAKDKKVTIHYAIQTNGSIITEKWCEFFRRHHFLVGLSIDMDKEFHDLNRVDAKQQGTYKRVIRTKALLDKYKVDYNILTVLTNQTARHPKKIFEFLLKNQIRYVQFIPCLDDLEAEERSAFALTPEYFASFYTQLFRYWLREYQQGHYISIKLFDDVGNLYGKGLIGACGMLGNCNIQYVIEADGSVYPCDFYATDAYCLGNIQEHTLRELFAGQTAACFLQTAKQQSDYCQHCEFQFSCYGGCKRMKRVMYVNESDTFCGYQAFLRECAETLKQLAKKEERSR
ncbi:radical SAM/SPASM domain-containing protein [Listeria grayi]|uniref:radical SAM/SPASM domain-containing protein n=1 Tax=Listeria grayi TaxID=1641 RepID=UPI00162971BD|nr:radical SAM protein [Listeria grayi]MBC1921724.1 SPASM domain-containing protein [Listeria grayi]